MSAGITPYDFVQQVYYTQEKVILDFWPDDDKYKEVLMEANLVLQELQKEEDWNWLREDFRLGPTGEPNNNIRSFRLDNNVTTPVEDTSTNTYTPANTGDIYKPCTLYGDCIRLYRADDTGTERANDWDYIRVPFISVGAKDFIKYREFNSKLSTNVLSGKLCAVYYGGIITFNRPLMGPELGRIAYVDIQRRLQPIHICNSACRTGNGEIPDYSEVTSATDLSWNKKCNKIESILFTEIPDPNYMVMRTAYKHAMGSPSAQGRLADLQDDSQKLLSAMRANNAMATTADHLDWDAPGFIDVT